MPVQGLALVRISIHAPPRGATELRIHDRRAASHFNSRPSARGDRLATTTCPLNGIFQFTPLREGRPRRVGSAERWLYHFNSRPSARGDLALVASTIGFGISIHAPPRGATWRWSPPPSALVFQFTPLREGRQHLRRHYKKSFAISIHAPPRGATAAAQSACSAATISIHAPPRGATHNQICVLARHGHFNSRPSARGDVLVRTFVAKARYFNSRPSARGDDV